MKRAMFWNIKNPVRTSHETHYVSSAEPRRFILCKIWSFDGGDNAEVWDVTPCGVTSQKTAFMKHPVSETFCFLVF
jgi:hypothetical protein